MVRRSVHLAHAIASVALAALPQMAFGDIVQPISLQLREQEPNTFLVQWQVPQTYPVRAMPEPVLPEDCQPRGERLLQERPGTWLNQQAYRCTDGVTGRKIGIRYPFVVAGQSSMMRVELLSGEKLVHALNPGEDSWSVPEIDAGFSANLWVNVRRAVLDGVRHFLGGWVHIAFWLVVALLAGSESSIRSVTAFSSGQLLALLVATASGSALPAPLAEGGLALAVILLANEVLKPPEDRRELLGLSAVAGLVHGVGLGSLMPSPASFAGLEWLYLFLVVLAMDSVLLVLGLIAPGIRYLMPGRSWSRSWFRGLAYGVGALGVATLWIGLVSPSVEADSGARLGLLPSLPGSEASSGMPGSRPVAAQGIQAPVQSFLSIEAFEVRHQILVRLRDLKATLALESGDVLPIEAQPEIKERLQDLVLPLASVSLDGEVAEPLVDRIDFLVVESTGVMPRSEPVLERVEEAFLGITLVYVTAKTPDRVTLTWESFPEGIQGIPATASDPEFSQTVALTAEAPMSVWENNLSVDLVPTVSAIAVEPRVLPVPLAAIPFLVVSALSLISAVRKRDASSRWVWMRVSLAVALLVAPIGEVAIALPASFQKVPSAGEARRILAGVLPNVYRAFEFREESAAYDRLAVSVTGDTLAEIYLEHRRALEMEERGGARARVEAVEVEEVRRVRPTTDGGFEADAVWAVGGTVTHFGHRHFRQNRYDARVHLVPVDDHWKIRSIELFDEERLR